MRINATITEYAKVEVSEGAVLEAVRNSKDISARELALILRDKWLGELLDVPVSQPRIVYEYDEPYFVMEYEGHTSHSWYYDKKIRKATPEEVVIFETLQNIGV